MMRGAAFAVFALFFPTAFALRRKSKRATNDVSDHALDLDKEDSEATALGVAGRVMSVWIPMLQARNINTTIASETIADIDRAIARIMADLPEQPLSGSDAQYCQEMENSGIEEYLTEVNKYFKKDPLGGIHLSNVDEVFGLFGSSSMFASASSVRRWALEDMFDDTIARFGPNGKQAEGFDSWTASTLSKYPGLQATVTDVFTLTRRLAEYQQTGDVVRERMFWMVVDAVERANEVAWYRPDVSYIEGLGLEKSLLVFLPIQLAAEVAAGNVNEEESNAVLRAILTENIRWATSVENLGHYLFQGGSMENVNFGSKMLQKIWATCISWKYNPATVAWDMIAPENLKDHAMALYNVWNSRFVHFYAGAVTGAMGCSDDEVALATPLAITHVAGSLALSISADAGNNLWSSYRPISLILVMVAIGLDCDGKVYWKDTFF